MNTDVNNSQDYLDIRNIITWFEELETCRENACDGEDDAADADKLKTFDESDDGAEYATLKSLLDDLAGNGGDHQWRGDWYPVTLIRDSYWMESAQEYAEDIHVEAIRMASWPMNCIDWERAARELQMDYSSVKYGGVTYWYR